MPIWAVYKPASVNAFWVLKDFFTIFMTYFIAELIHKKENVIIEILGLPTLFAS